MCRNSKYIIILDIFLLNKKYIMYDGILTTTSVSMTSGILHH